MADKYLEKAKELAKEFGLTDKSGIFSLRCDIREAHNHFFPNTPIIILDYIEFCLRKNLYQVDPFAKNRLRFDTLERLVKEVDFDSYDSINLFLLKNVDNKQDDFDEFVNELFEKRIIRKETL